jgi:glutathione synthase/RimK-type ligase-like ATP-grasp enzyme
MILGVHREYNQAGKPESDKVIADLVGNSLRTLGYEVRMVDGEALDLARIEKPELVFSMARSAGSLETLSSLESDGVPVVNSPGSIRLCYNRAEVYRLMESNGFPVPDTSLKSLSNIGTNYPFLLKKPDTHGKKGDTFLVKSREDARAAVQSLEASGAKMVLLQAFVPGESHKFYGVGNDVFLPDFQGNSQPVKEHAVKLAQIIGMDVYGGDFIHGNDGKYYLIDFNDWPSFSPIRDLAAERITKLLTERLGR